MILRPEDENITGQPRRVSFTGVGASRTSLCASPDDEKDAYCNEQISRSHGNYGKNQSSIPSSGDVKDDVKSEDGHDGTVNDGDDQSGHDHREGDEMLVSRNQFNNEDVGADGRDDNEVECDDDVEYEQKDPHFSAKDVDDDESSKKSASRDENGVDGDNSPGCEESLGDQHVPAHRDEREVEGDDDVEKEQEDPQFSANDVDDDESSKTSVSRDENGMHGDNSQVCEESLGEEHVPAHEDERKSVDDDQRHPTSSHSLEIKGSMPMDSLQSSSHHGQNFDAKPYQGDSTPSLQRSAKRQSETSRKCSDASTSATRSRRSSSSSSSGSSSGSSTESSSGSDSDSSSTDSDSESSCSSSCSSSSSSSSSSNSDSSSSDCSSSSSGSDSASSCTDDVERQNYNTRAGKRYRVSSKKSRRVSSSHSGRLSSDFGTSSSDSSGSSPDSGRSSLSFASEIQQLERRNKKKKSMESDGLYAQNSTKSHERMKQYGQSQRIVHQETCSPVCVIS